MAPCGNKDVGMSIFGNSVRVAALALSVAFLAFVIGIAVASARVYPYKVFADAFQGLDYVYNYVQVRLIAPTDNPYLYVARSGKTDGVVRLDPDRAQPGLTLFTSGQGSAAYLITLDGRLVHEWAYPFSKAWPNPPHVKNPIRDSNIFWRRAHVYPNGDLLAIYEAPGDSPQSYGLIKIDKDSNFIWGYPELVHHDFDVAADGHIYTLINVIRDGPIPELEAIRNRFATVSEQAIPYPVLDDSVVELTADGKEVRRVSILDAFLNSKYASILSIAPMRRWDVLHANSVEVIDENFAKRHPELKAGQVLISMKEISAIAALDLDRKTIVWAKLGSWREQHDAETMANGDILMFDNFGNIGPGSPSRILEIDPTDAAEDWSYGGSGKEPFFSSVRSSQQQLANGDLLVTSSNESRIFELTRDGNIVWEFINPATTADTKSAFPTLEEVRPILCSAQRLDPDSLTFLR
jgi:hypothetical protein